MQVGQRPAGQSVPPLLLLGGSDTVTGTVVPVVVMLADKARREGLLMLEENPSYLSSPPVEVPAARFTHSPT